MPPGWLGGCTVGTLLLLTGASLQPAEVGSATSAQPRIATVTGELAAPAMGAILVHEHLFLDFLFPMTSDRWRGGPPNAGLVARMSRTGYPVPVGADRLAFWTAPMQRGDRPPNAGWASADNMRLDSLTLAVDALRKFRAAGGAMVVDVTTPDLGRRADLLRRASLISGVPVVMGTGLYRHSFHPDWVRNTTVEDLADRFAIDVTAGVTSHRIRAGVIGEIAIDKGHGGSAKQPYDPSELKVLRAAARASRRTGAALILHAPGEDLSYLQVIDEERVDRGRVLLSHGYGHFRDRARLARLLRAGWQLGIDFELQREATGRLPGLGPILENLVWAVRSGHLNQIFLSLDLCTKSGFKGYGGGGFETIFEEVTPKLREGGVTEQEIRTILHDNPVRLLALQESLSHRR